LFKFHYFGSISFAEKFYRFEVDCFVREDERKEGATSKVAKSKKNKRTNLAIFKNVQKNQINSSISGKQYRK